MGRNMESHAGKRGGKPLLCKALIKCADEFASIPLNASGRLAEESAVDMEDHPFAR